MSSRGIWLIIIFVIWNRQSFAFRTLLLFPIYMTLWRFFESFNPKNSNIEHFDVKLFTIVILLSWLIFSLLKYKDQFIQDFCEFWNSKRNIGAAVLLISMPFLRDFWKYLPEGTGYYDLYFFQFGSYGFKDANGAFYYLFVKICFLIPILIFYFRTRDWIRYTFLSAVILYIYQIINLFGEDSGVVDEIEVVQSAPVLTLLAIFLVAIAQIVEHQSRVALFLETKYSKIKEAVGKRNLERQKFIEEYKKELHDSLNNLKGLKELKSKLEQELNSK